MKEHLLIIGNVIGWSESIDGDNREGHTLRMYKQLMNIHTHTHTYTIAFAIVLPGIQCGGYKANSAISFLWADMYAIVRAHLFS